jgi:pimeloyl-ACP methyl ester carboxylesterase
VPYTEGNGPRIYFEANSPIGDDPVVLLEGMGAQMIGWRRGFLDLLTAHGLSVIVMDNRDVGLSEKLGGWRDTTARYSVRDMADDVCRVLDTLGLASAHVIGQSMGGVIAQAMAIHRPDRMRSLTLFYTVPAFDEALLQPDFVKRLAAGLPKLPFRIPRWLMVRMFLADTRRCFSAAYPADEAWLRELVRTSYARGFRLDGIARQMAAVRAGFDHRRELSAIKAPTAIIHGHADHLIKAEAAFELAAAIPNAGLHLYPGMGHAIAEPLWPNFASIISRNARRHRK